MSVCCSIRCLKSSVPAIDAVRGERYLEKGWFGTYMSEGTDKTRLGGRSPGVREVEITVYENSGQLQSGKKEE